MATQPQAGKNPPLSRREFLRLGALAAVGAALASCAPPPTPEVIIETVPVVQTAIVKETVQINVEKTIMVTTAPTIYTTPVPKEPVNLIWMSGNLDVQTDVTAFVKDNPDIAKIDIIADDDTRFKAMLAAGAPPDLKQTSGRQIPYYVNRQILLDISPLIDADKEVTRDNLLPVHSWMQYDGKNIGQGHDYGLINDWSPDFSNWLDTRVFDELKLPVPSLIDPIKYDDATALAEKLTRRDSGRTLRFGFSDMYNYLVERICQQACLDGGTKLYDEFLSTINLVGNAPAVKVLTWQANMAHKHFMPSTADTFGGWDAQLWTTGKFGMLTWVGYGLSGAIRMWAASDDKIVEMGKYIQLLPAFVWDKMQYNPSAGALSTSTAAATSTSIIKATQSVDQAWKLLKFQCVGGLAEARAKAGWGLPSFKPLLDDLPSATDFDKRINVAVQEAIKHADLQGTVVNPYYDTDFLGDTWFAQLDQVLHNKQSLDDAIKNTQDKVNQAIKDGIDATK